jgi:hypothetical protein
VVSSISNNTHTLVLDGAVSVGTVFTETYSYDSNLPDDHPADSTYGGYSPIPPTCSPSAITRLFDPSPGGFIVIQNDFFNRDAYFADGFFEGTGEGANILSIVFRIRDI